MYNEMQLANMLRLECDVSVELSRRRAAGGCAGGVGGGGAGHLRPRVEEPRAAGAITSCSRPATGSRTRTPRTRWTPPGSL